MTCGVPTFTYFCKSLQSPYSLFYNRNTTGLFISPAFHCACWETNTIVCCVLITLKLDKCKCFSELASVFPNIFLFLPTAQQKQIYLLRWPNDNDSLHCRNVIRLSQMALLVTSFLLAACLLSLL